jgi:hypothetical protein
MAAAVTSRIRVGTGVLLAAQRDPIVTAKALATIDQQSGGRLAVGVGYGWNLEEMRDHGVDPATRRARVRDHVLAMRRLWEEEEAEFHGQYAEFAPSWCWPKPAQRPLPVLVGGAATRPLAPSAKPTLRRPPPTPAIPAPPITRRISHRPRPPPHIHHPPHRPPDGVRHPMASAIDRIGHPMASAIDRIHHPMASAIDRIHHPMASSTDRIHHPPPTASTTQRVRHLPHPPPDGVHHPPHPPHPPHRGWSRERSWKKSVCIARFSSVKKKVSKIIA